MMRFLLCLMLMFAGSASAAEFTLKQENGQALIAMDGQIYSGDDRKLAQLLSQARGQKVSVYLNSPGGDVDVGMALARTIRQSGAATYHGYCGSSCVFAFLGGVKRFANSKPGQVLNIHRPQLAEAHLASPSAFTTGMMKMLEDFTVEMIGTPDFYNFMMKVPFSAPQSLPAYSLMRLHVITEAGKN